MQLRVNDKEKVVIWGTGKYGQQALLQYKNVAYFIDNDTRRKGKIINGCQVMCFEDYLKDDNRYQIIIASRFWKSIVEQLKEAGISNYLIYPVSKFGINSAESLVYNPYVVGCSYSDLQDNCKDISLQEEMIKKRWNKYFEKEDRYFNKNFLKTASNMRINPNKVK